MSLPNGIPVKLGIYTLACHELFNRISELESATQNDTRLTYDTCLSRFDAALYEFFLESSGIDLSHAAEQFGKVLEAKAGLIQDQNEEAAAIFGDIGISVRNQAPSWNYEAELELFHRKGQELACRYYAGSPWLTSQKRFGHKCYLKIEYGSPSVDDRVGQLAETFKYPAAPIAYYPVRWDEDDNQNYNNVLLLRFTYNHDFMLYLAYPFLFLHEYTAHVYTCDQDNELFNDGWMMYAMDAFLRRELQLELLGATERTGLSRDQVQVFNHHLYTKINPNPRRGYIIAQDFHSFISNDFPERFTQITYELATQSLPGKMFIDPDQFINALYREFKANPTRILRKVKTTRTIRELMDLLSTD